VRTQGLTTEQLGDLARKTLDNAVSLLNEAEGLANFGRYPRAMALGVLAAEEFGKFQMCFRASAHSPDDTEYWKDFWKRFKGHAPKYQNAVDMVLMGVPAEDARRFQAEFERHVEADQERKFAGLYVDVDDDGVVWHPSDAVGPDETVSMLGVFDVVIRQTDLGWAETDFTDLFKKGIAAGAKELAMALERKDYEAVREIWNRTVGEGAKGGR
jgi:AbiV family abortive infection protein